MSLLQTSRGVSLRTNHTAAIVVVAGVSYYAGALAGLQFRLPPATPSVLWPPNAILTALLLFVPPSRWWAVFVGAAAAHFATELPVFPPSLVARLFLTNCSEAILAAGTVRLLSDAPSRFDTLRRVTIFVMGAGLAAPFASSFLDAGVVSYTVGENFWSVWRLRFLSNVLAQVTIVPAIAGLVNEANHVRRWTRRDWRDATMIAVGLVLVAALVSLDVGAIGLLRAPLAVFLPLLLWAAVRFGPPAVALAVLTTLVLAIGTEVRGYGSLLRSAQPEDRIGTLQMFFISASVPLLCVAALVEERRKAVAALQATDRLKSSILDSISSTVAVVDQAGRVVAVNESWLSDAHENGPAGLSKEPGTPYLDVWAAYAADGPTHARPAYHAIKEVLGRGPGATLEYPCVTRDGDRWWMMSVVPLKSADGGAVISHTDVTAWKRAEFEAQRTRDELAHVTRVWVMGELTAALSHQLNQPLTGIIGNANAGLRFLAAIPPNLPEVRDILVDISADAERAADVTRTVRDMLRRETTGRASLDVNEVVHDTANLVAGQSSIHRVRIELELTPAPPLVPGDRVQLRQVVLNLLMNAIESVTGDDDGRRMVLIRTQRKDETCLQLSVIDTGRGLPAGAEDQVFDPLFTTKAEGMGMGLPIARAIVEAHGGTMWAENQAAGGAAFHLTLPLSPEAEVSPVAATG